MIDTRDDIRDFHKKFGLSYDGPPKALDPETFGFRKKFMEEELREWSEAQGRFIETTTKEAYEKELENQLDALVDLLYVLLGTAHLQGFDNIFQIAWNRVHWANMRKVRATHAGQSKRGSTLDVVKPPHWVPPSHIDLIRGR